MFEPTKKPPPELLTDFKWGIKIPLRDGVQLNATVYLPRRQEKPAPAIFTLTPYVGQTYHDRGVYFAGHGYPFLTVDVRGRGNSEGEFHPFINEGRDGFDIVEWLARQPYCNGRVAMWGGSYGGYTQWMAANQFSPHLATIVPAASPYIGIDNPMRNNISYPYLIQWLTLIAGRTSQDKLFFGNEAFWAARYRDWFESGTPFKELDSRLGNPSPIFKEWLAHPDRDAYWDRYNPSAQDYAQLRLPILTITGIYDSDQPGALAHYRNYMANTSKEGRLRHYLLIGPWDHAGTRTPQKKFSGLECGAASLLDLPQLHVEWYAWTMQEGMKPSFLRKNVAYYVLVAERWRYAETLEAITARHEALYLDSKGSASHMFASGTLGTDPGEGPADRYVYDPRDTSLARQEAAAVTALSLRPTFPTDDLTDQKPVFLREGRQLIYHSAPFKSDTEVSGFFKLDAWLSIDQPDTDFSVSVYEIDAAGGSVLLTWDSMRARYRQGPHEGKLIRSGDPLRYDFEGFTFVSRLIRSGCRLRLIIGPINSIYSQKNYNSGGAVSEESMQDARTVTVKLLHDASHPSVLHVPIGQPNAPEESRT